MKILKRIGAFLLAIALIIGVVPMSSLAGSDSFALTQMTSNTHIRAGESEDEWLIYFNFTGTFGEEGERFPWPATLGGQETTVDVYKDGGMFLVWIYEHQIATDGSANTTLILKGNTAVNGHKGNTVTMDSDLTLCFNKYGVAVSTPITPATTGVSFTKLTVGANSHIYMRASVDDAMPDITDANNWLVRPKAASGYINDAYYIPNQSGVKLGDTFYEPNVDVNGDGTVEIEFIKQKDSGDAVLDYFINPGTVSGVGTLLEFGGLFVWDGTLVEYAPTCMEWDGSTWNQIDSNYMVTFESHNAELSNSNLGSSGIYFVGTPDNALSVEGANQIQYTAANEESGIWLGEEKQTNAHIRKVAVDGNEYYQVAGYRDLQAGDILTIKGRFTNAGTHSGITLSSEVQLKWTGSGWGDATQDAGPVEFVLDGINAATTFSDDANGWHVYLTPSAVLPGTADVPRFKGLKMTLNDGTPFDVDIVKSSHQGTVYLFLPADILPKQVVSNTKIVLQAGDAVSAENLNVRLTRDFAIYVNAKGISTTGFIGEPEYTEFVLGGINAATTFSDDANGWHVYLTPSAVLPGTADVPRFKGLKMTLNDGTPIDVDIVKSSHQGTVYLFLPADILPKNVVSDTKIVIQAGDAVSNENLNVRLTRDFAIYVNAKGISTTGFIKGPEYTEFALGGINEATAFSGDANGWHVYLTPSAALPGTVDAPRFKGLKMTLNDGTPIDVDIVKSSHQGTVYLFLPADILPKNIEENTKIVLKSGEAVSNEEHCVKLTDDFTIYANEYGWTTTGFIQEPACTGFKINGMNSATAYDEAAGGWHVYFEPSATLPGTADLTHFKGIQVTFNDSAVELDVVKSSHLGTAYMFFPADILPKNIKEDTKIVVKSGIGLTGDGTGIKLTEDYVIYVNKFGWSTTGFVKEIVPSETNVNLTIDRSSVYGGDEKGIYLITGDHFPVDTTWATRIYGPTYDDNSGVFLNGEKISGQLIRFAEGKLYVSLSDGGYEANDKDVLTVKGLFTLGTYGVTYKEANFHFNGKIWNDTYVKAAPETYTKFAVESIHAVTNFNAKSNSWNMYLDVSAMLPGEIDLTSFHNLTLQIGSKSLDVRVAHSHEHTLWVGIAGTDLPENAPDGTKVILKAGKALANDKTTGIELTKDFVFYTYRGSLTTTKPTTDTEWEDVTLTGLLRACVYSEPANSWTVFVKVQDELYTEIGTKYLQLPVEINGKTYKLTATQEGTDFFHIGIPGDILPADTKKATISIKEGSEATGNAGYDGIRVQNDYTIYLFNGVISDTEFTEVEAMETAFSGLHNTDAFADGNHVYFRITSDFPGTAWYEFYEDFVYYYNGKEINTHICKYTNKCIYFPIETAKVGKMKEGDMIEVKDGTKVTCGGYEIILTKGFKMIYKDGIWSQYVESDVQKPDDIGSLWSVARFDPAYIPTTEDGSVYYTGDDVYNAVTSMEALKDYTVSFKAKKAYDDEMTTGFKVILRGTPISEDNPMTTTLLNGYVISFEAAEVENPDNPEDTIWAAYLNLWKNGENAALIDEYRIAYVYSPTEHPFFEYDKDYDFEFSIYNVTETCVCIEITVNGELVMRQYDEAGGDPADPAINAGTFGIYGTGPNYITDDIVELKEVISEKDECVTGEEVRVAATYPSVIEGAEFTVDKKGAAVTDGVFKADKAGTYTVSCTYNGTQLKEKTITVTEAEESNTNGNIQLLPILAISGVTLVAAGAIVIFVLRRKKGRSDEKV